MVGIAAAIAARFPSARPLLDWGVLFNGTSDEIYLWDVDAMGRPVPSEAELTEWAALPPPPAPDWLGFAGWLYVFAPIAQAMEAARLSTDPQGEPATTGLPAALQEARLNQNYPAWAATWGQFLLASAMPPEALAEIVDKATACNLPAEFIAALQPLPPAS